MNPLTRDDLQAALDLATKLAACTSIGDVELIMLPAVAQLVHGELAIYIQTSTHGLHEVSIAWPAESFRLEDAAGYASVMSQHPVRALHASGDTAEWARLSDLLSRREWHEHPVYRESHRLWGVEDQVLVKLGQRDHSIHALSISRSGRSFTDRECELLCAVTPFLRATVRRALQCSTPYVALRIAPTVAVEVLSGSALMANRGPMATLTSRERAILELVAEGLTSAQSARRLDVSPRTVEKHLEHIHAKLGVTNRVAALEALRAANGAAPW